MSNNDPLVTVIMAAYNSESSVGATIESVRNQTFTDWTLVVVDDCSTDGTLSVLKGFAEQDKRIRVIAGQENRGQGHCRNVAIAATSSPLIAVLDADDICLPDRLQQQVDFMREHPEVDVLGGAAYYIFPDRPDSPVLVCRPETHEELVRAIYTECPFVHPTVMYRRSYIEQAKGYRVELRRGQDSDLWFRTYRVARFHNLQVPLVNYSCRPRTRLRDALYATRARYEMAARDKRLLTSGWHIMRPLAHYALVRMKLRSPFGRSVDVGRQAGDG